MSTRYGELTKILRTGSAGTSSSTPAEDEQQQTSRRDELYSLLGGSTAPAPDTAASGASTTQRDTVTETQTQGEVVTPSVSSADSSPKGGASAATPQAALPTASLVQGILAGGAEQVTQAPTAAKPQMTQSEAQAELDRLKPVLEQAKQYENEMGRYVSGAGQDPALYHSALTRRDSLLKKYGYSSVDELNKAVMDYTLAAGNELSLMQKLDRAGSAMEEGLKKTVLSGDWWKNVVLGGAEQWAGSQLNAAGTTAGNIESIGKEGTGMVYENELRARNDWATTLEEAKTGVIQMDADGIKEIENIIAYYDNILLPSLRSGVQAYETLAEDSAAAADEITAKGQQNTEEAKEGLGWGGQLAVDLLTQGTMIALDKATGAPNISMFTRGLGSGAQEARQDGGSAQKQIGYGAAVGTVEVLTNKLFDGLAGIYGKGAADDLVEATIAKLAKSMEGQAALRLLASGFGEGIEEILSDAINPLLRTIYSDKSIKEEYSEEQLSQWLYDGLVGGIMGTGMTAVNPETYAFNPGKPQISADQEKTRLQPQADGQAEEQTAGMAETPTAQTQEKSYPTVEELIQPIRPAVNAEAQTAGTADVGESPQPEAPQSTPARPVMDTAENLTGIPGPVQRKGQGNNAPLQQNIDNGETTAYNNNRITNGGAEDGIRTAGLQQDDAGRSAEANRRGIPGVYQYSNSDNSGWGRSGEVPVGTGFVLISENARKRLNERGVAVVEARDASSDKAAFSSALESARENDPDNGWAVTPKSAEELEQSGARLLMDERGSAGLSVTPDGDIEAVFANHAAGAPKGATKSLIPMAIANGGKKLDCYGIDLVKLYAQYGFTPVARVKFDPEYANPGWDSSKGTPDIYFLIHNGDSADSVVDKIGTYPIPTAEELHALPEMDYDSAYAYRDRLLAERSGKGSPQGGSSAATPQSVAPTALLAEEPLREAQTQATEAAQEAQRATPQAETPPATANAAQTASDALNRQAETNAQGQTENAEADAQFNELTQRYGAIPTGETPARDVQVPQRISADEAVGRTARTIMEAAATPDNRLGSVREAVVDGKFSYTEISNRELADSAAQRIQYDGWQKSLNDWTAAVRQNQANENLAAMGAQLLNNAGNSDMSAEQYIDLATDYNRLMHNLGRGLAAARILKTLTPEGKLYGIQRSIQSMVDEANGKYKVEIDPALIDEYRAQTTDEGRDAVISKMQQNIADQIPSTWMDKFTALRYTNMLGNFKTQARNISGNILMTLGRTVKDKLAAVIESAASAASGGQVERTKSLWAGTPLYGEAMRDFTNVEREALGESKYSDSGREFDREVQEKRTIFKNNGKWGTDEAKTGIGRSAAAKGARKVSDLGMAGMEAYRKATNWAMEQGDRIFVRINYADALAGWLKAHGISSIAEADADTLDRARQYAIKQAQEATFRDTNSVSQFVSTFDKGWGKTGFGRGVQKVMQGIAPFRKTPANVAVRAEEYSPLGILNTAYKAFEAKQGKNDVTWSDMIDSAAKTLTGSGIYFLGYLMAAAGSARGKEEDEKKAAFENMQGLQDYSIILPNGKSISMNWVAPYSIPFFMGVLTQEAAADGGLSWDDAGKILGAVSDPMLEMSMLSGLNDALDNISQYNGDADALPQFLMNAFASYLSQGVTNTLLGQFEQASQETRQTTYTDSTLKIPTSLQYILGKASAKTPGVDYNQQDYIDAWGRKQSTGTAVERIINSFINPAYVNEDRSTPVDDELQRLYDAGQTNVLPQKAARSTKVNGERLSPDEYEAYSITKGQQSLELVQDFIESDAYQNMSDDARAKIISDLYNFAASRAAKEIAGGRKESYTSKWDDEAKLSDVVGYLTSKSQIKSAQDSKDYTLLDELLDTVTEQKADVRGKLYKDFSMLDELLYGKDHGVDSKTVMTAKEKADANGNGKISQEELWYYLGIQKNMPTTTKSVLWDILTTGKTGYAQYAEKQK